MFAGGPKTDPTNHGDEMITDVHMLLYVCVCNTQLEYRCLSLHTLLGYIT